jgi:hypothetical protein
VRYVRYPVVLSRVSRPAGSSSASIATPQAANIAATVVVAISRSVRLIFPSIPLTQSPTDLLGERVAPLAGSLPDSVALPGTTEVTLGDFSQLPEMRPTHDRRRG